MVLSATYSLSLHSSLSQRCSRSGASDVPFFESPGSLKNSEGPAENLCLCSWFGGVRFAALFVVVPGRGGSREVVVIVIVVVESTAETTDAAAASACEVAAILVVTVAGIRRAHVQQPPKQDFELRCRRDHGADEGLHGRPGPCVGGAPCHVVGDVEDVVGIVYANAAGDAEEEAFGEDCCERDPLR